MRINNISNITNVNNASFQGKKSKKYKRGLLLALVPTSIMGTMPKSALADSVYSKQQPTAIVETVQQDVYPYWNFNRTSQVENAGKIQPSEINYKSTPITEFYLPGDSWLCQIYPNENIERNDKGSIIVTITDKKSDNVTEGRSMTLSFRLRHPTVIRMSKWLFFMMKGKTMWTTGII